MRRPMQSFQPRPPARRLCIEAGALRAAADSFAARADARPRDPAHWFNLGATLYRAGADGKATAAWTRAARLAPRDASIRRARALLPPPDVTTEKLLRVGWATPGEWSIIGAAAWIAFWFAVAIAPRRRVILVALGVVTLAAAMFGAIEQVRRDLPTAVVVADAAPIQASAVRQRERGRNGPVGRRGAGRSQLWSVARGATQRRSSRLGSRDGDCRIVSLLARAKVLLLTDQVADQIAAGEVVERPASVVRSWSRTRSMPAPRRCASSWKMAARC